MDVYDYYITPAEYAEAERNGISRRRVEDRIRLYAWGKQRAITTPTGPYKDRSHLRKVMAAHGISYVQFLGRLGWGWDELSAATRPLRDKKGLQEQAYRMHQMNRKHPRELVELAASNGISECLFHYRMRKGWSYEMASTLSPSYSNGSMIVKQKYGEDFYRNSMKKFFLKKKK